MMIPGSSLPFRGAWGILLLTAVVALLVAPCGCGERGSGERTAFGGPSGSSTPALTPGSASGYNLVLVSLDTVRADRLGCYGYDPAETPAIDSLAATGLLVGDAVAPVPLTLPSHATMLTGLGPREHGVRNNGGYKLAPRFETLAETLAARGYETAAFIAAFVLDRRFGLDQGFDHYDFSVPAGGGETGRGESYKRPAKDVTDAAITWLRRRETAQQESPFFLLLHYFDAHIPHRSPFTRLPRFAGRPYDAEIAYIDSHLSRFLEELESLQLDQRTLIALVSDHGESLGEHGEATHGLFIYDCTMRVAFILSCPSLFSGPLTLDGRVVSLEDLRPTLEDLLGLPVSPTMEGISLAAALPGPDRMVRIESLLPYEAARCSPLYGIRRHTDKYIHGPEPEYFDLLRDPGELNNLHGSQLPETVQLSAEVQSWLEGKPDREPVAGSERTLSREEIAQLAALGYLRAEPSDDPATLPDPKAVVRANLKIKEAFGHMRHNRLEEALRAGREAWAECPAYGDTAIQLAMIHERMNNLEDAVSILREAISIRPGVQTSLHLTQLLFRLDRLEEMDEPLATAERLDPLNGFVPMFRGDRLLKEGRMAEALEMYRQALLLDEARVGHVVRPQIERLERMIEAGGTE